jgi:Arc/MetJ-type ribon-helix-helix transcriptional regulator
MALTTEQIDQIAYQEASEAGRRAHEIAMESRRAKLEAIRLAKETLIENARSKPADSRDVTPADITAFADALVASISA